jgi:hypothetical protein
MKYWRKLKSDYKDGEAVRGRKQSLIDLTTFLGTGDIKMESTILGPDGRPLQRTEFTEEILLEQEAWQNIQTGEITWKYRRADRMQRGDTPEGMTEEKALDNGFTVIKKWTPGDL